MLCISYKTKSNKKANVIVIKKQLFNLVTKADMNQYESIFLQNNSEAFFCKATQK